MLSENVIELIKETRKLRRHAHDMEMATRYKKFNYGYIDRLIQKIIEEDCNEKGIEALHAKEIK